MSRRGWTDENGDVWPDCIGVGSVTTVPGKSPRKKSEPIGFIHFPDRSPKQRRPVQRKTRSASKRRTRS